jgi:hypothetical protein
MNITIGKFSFDVLLLIRLWLPAIVFIGLCTGIFIAFDSLLLLLDQIAPGLIPVAWLSLFVLYIVLGVTFTFIVARMVRRSFKSKELLVQRRMAYLSGLSLYACGLLFLGASIRANFIPVERAVTDMNQGCPITFPVFSWPLTQLFSHLHTLDRRV